MNNKCKMKYDSKALKTLKKLKPKPMPQEKVGRTLNHYWKRLHGEAKLPEGLQLDEKFTREEVRSICISSQYAPLDAYAVAMAWGGQNLKHFESSTKNSSGKNLEGLLIRLRQSTRSRAEDFDDCKQTCDNITGLGMSFFTKLLYFFRPINSEQAFILDQWTAKGASILLADKIISVDIYGMPLKKITGDDYEQFCLFIGDLADQLTTEKVKWTPDQAEVAIFDRPRAAWRDYLAERLT